MDRGAQTGGLTDDLPYLDLISHADHGLAGGAQMHRHRDDHLRRSFCERDGGLALGQIFVFSGMHSAEKLMQHSLTSIFSLSLFPKELHFETSYIIVHNCKKVQSLREKSPSKFHFTERKTSPLREVFLFSTHTASLPISWG